MVQSKYVSKHVLFMLTAPGANLVSIPSFALLLAVKTNADAQLHWLTDDFLTAHPPKEPLAQAVKVCRVQKMHVSHKKLFRLDDKPLEEALVAL